MPLPCLPVDSATNCSSQAPRAEIPGEVMMVTLSRPLRAAVPRMTPSKAPGILFDGNAGSAGLHHFLGAAQETADIQTHKRRGHHAKVRKRGIASANAGQAGKNMPEVIGLGHLLHF